MEKVEKTSMLKTVLNILIVCHGHSNPPKYQTWNTLPKMMTSLRNTQDLYQNSKSIS